MKSSKEKLDMFEKLDIKKIRELETLHDHFISEDYIKKSGEENSKINLQIIEIEYYHVLSNIYQRRYLVSLFDDTMNRTHRVKLLNRWNYAEARKK